MLSKIEFIREYYPDLLIMDGFDDCIIGICSRFGQSDIVAYDLKKVIEKLMADGMTEEQAYEYYEFNQLGAGMGDLTPCFIDTLGHEE